MNKATTHCPESRHEFRIFELDIQAAVWHWEDDDIYVMGHGEDENLATAYIKAWTMYRDQPQRFSQKEVLERFFGPRPTSSPST